MLIADAFLHAVGMESPAVQEVEVVLKLLGFGPVDLREVSGFGDMGIICV